MSIYPHHLSGGRGTQTIILSSCAMSFIFVMIWLYIYSRCYFWATAALVRRSLPDFITGNFIAAVMWSLSSLFCIRYHVRLKCSDDDHHIHCYRRVFSDRLGISRIHGVSNSILLHHIPWLHIEWGNLGCRLKSYFCWLKSFPKSRRRIQ